MTCCTKLIVGQWPPNLILPLKRWNIISQPFKVSFGKDFTYILAWENHAQYKIGMVSSLCSVYSLCSGSAPQKQNVWHRNELFCNLVTDCRPFLLIFGIKEPWWKLFPHILSLIHSEGIPATLRVISHQCYA